MFAAFRIEFHSESFFQRRADNGKRRQMPFIGAEFRLAGIGGEKPCHVFRAGQRRRVEQNPLEKFFKAGAELLRRFLGASGSFPELCLIWGKPVRFQFRRLAFDVLADKHEVAVIRHEHLAVFAPVTGYLRPVRYHPGIVACGFDFNDAASGDGTFRQFLLRPALKLIGGEEPTIGNARSPVLNIDNAADLRLQGLANAVKQVGNGGVVRRFLNCAPG